MSYTSRLLALLYLRAHVHFLIPTLQSLSHWLHLRWPCDHLKCSQWRLQGRRRDCLSVSVSASTHNMMLPYTDITSVDWRILVITGTSHECHCVSIHRPLGCLFSNLGLRQRNLRISAFIGILWESNRDRRDSPHKGPVMRKVFPFLHAIMVLLCLHSNTLTRSPHQVCFIHDDVIKWKHFPRCWPFVRGIHRSPVNSPHKDQWRGALMFTLICARINGWVNNRKAGDLRRHRAYYDVIVMSTVFLTINR